MKNPNVLHRLPWWLSRQGTQEMQVRSLDQEDPLEEGMATPVFLPGESHGQRSLEGYTPQSHKESDMTEVAQQACMSTDGSQSLTFLSSIFQSFCFQAQATCHSSGVHIYSNVRPSHHKTNDQVNQGTQPRRQSCSNPSPDRLQSSFLLWPQLNTGNLSCHPISVLGQDSQGNQVSFQSPKNLTSHLSFFFVKGCRRCNNLFQMAWQPWKRTQCRKLRAPGSPCLGPQVHSIPSI